jgi:hypothetical protein
MGILLKIQYFTCIVGIFVSSAVPWLKRLVAGITSRRPGFAPGSVYVGFVADKVALGQVFIRVLRVFPCQYHSTIAPYSPITAP